MNLDQIQDEIPDVLSSVREIEKELECVEIATERSDAICSLQAAYEMAKSLVRTLKSLKK